MAQGITQNSLPIQPHRRVFDRILVIPSTLDGAQVSWELDTRNFKDAGPYNFTLQWAENNNASYIDVAGPTSGNFLVDNERRLFSKLPYSVYRIKLVTAQDEYYSDPEPILGKWNRHDYLLAKDIVRREFVRLKKFTGTQGLYLGRKQWGTACNNCLDELTGMPTQAHCTVCYGTGYIGGYYTPVEFWVTEDTINMREQTDPNRNVTSDQVQMVRVVAAPYLTAKDVWINTTTDERWFVESKKELAVIRGRPLVTAVELRKVEPDNVVYTLPVSQTSSSSGAI